jgi:hypothetical protein
MAFRKGKPMGTMIREWVLERLSQEQAGFQTDTSKVYLVLDEIHEKLNDFFKDSKMSNQSSKPLEGSSDVLL